jgi:glycosyltransferase involved in cell wall biosynthesis
MVGTLEPRKGYTDTLNVFDALWRQGQDINLVIVGKVGWKVEALVARIKEHPEFNQRLFWLAGISDEYLDRVYNTCTCLIAASYGEGFGLPLIESAQRGLPIIARDIPVFREVAGKHATYLPPDLQAITGGAVIKQWLEKHRKDEVRGSDAMPWLTWQESSKVLLDKMAGQGSKR